MTRTIQYGCKKCGGVVTAEMYADASRTEIRSKDCRLFPAANKVEIQCKKCNKAAAVIIIQQA